MSHDVLTELRTKGNARRDRWHGPDTIPWGGADWSNAMCGEAGEAANVVKKIRRIETGTGSQDDLALDELRQMLADELGDVLAYADLLAQHYDIDLRRAVADKFNRVSEREGFPERIDVDHQQPAAETPRRLGDARTPSMSVEPPRRVSEYGLDALDSSREVPQ